MRTLHFMAIAFTLLLGGGLASVPIAPVPSGADDPCLAVWHENREGTRLAFAIWADDTYLCRALPYDIQSPLVVATAREGSCKLLLSRVTEAGMFNQIPAPGFAPDSSITSLYARSGQREARYRHNEWLGVGRDLTSMQAFLSMWLDVRAAIARVVPVRVQTLESALDASGRYRGYRPTRPEETAWRK